jgi:hypothetical protein
MRFIVSQGLASVAAALVVGCGGGGAPHSSDAVGAGRDPDSPPVSSSPPAFANATPASGLFWVVGFTQPPFASGLIELVLATFGGAAAGDCDGDEDIDLFVTYGDSDGNGPGGPNRLYLNQLDSGNPLLFIDRAEVAGVANTRRDGLGNDRHSGPVFADMDGDGDLDLFIGGILGDPNKLYENHGDCSFSDVTANSPDVEAITRDPDDASATVAVSTLSAAFGDYDLDGDLDLFLTHWLTPDSLYTGTDVAGAPRLRETHHLWRNESDAGGIRFVNVSEISQVSELVWQTRSDDSAIQNRDFTFTPTFARIDGDLWPDIAIAGDFGTSQLLLNNADGSGRFRSLANPILSDAYNGMGSALGDIDDDGDLDWFVTSIYGPTDQPRPLRGNRLFRNRLELNEPGLFTDETEALGVADGAFGWGACFVDIDNDRDLDIYHTNGWPGQVEGFAVYYDDRSRVFLQGSDGSFAGRARALGLDDNLSGRGVVCADFDHDGDVDILQLTDDDSNSARLWENRAAAAGRNFLRVRLLGLPPNTQAAGARIFATIGSRTQMREIMIGSNYTSQNPTVQIFGLGDASSVDELRVEWPALLPGPAQPDAWFGTSVPASVSGQTMLICHPDLIDAPDVCSPSE